MNLNSSIKMLWLFFFFQAEDGIRDLTVTGVQTCALPISSFTMSAISLLSWRRLMAMRPDSGLRSEEHTSELQSQSNLVCRLLLEKKKDVRQPLPYETASLLSLPDRATFSGAPPS